MTPTLQNQWFETFKETTLFHRYISYNHISSLLNKHLKYFDNKIIGESVLGIPIHAITVGSGELKVLMWSQMHGNESTTTKAIFDLLNLFVSRNHEKIEKILNSCTIAIIPMLNPDGANAYTRLNANEVDLNRDAQELSQPESKILRAFFNEFKPNFCFNLHGQRTIFSAGKSIYPATISLLAPAQDKKCTVTKNRKRAMELISVINNVLQQEIPNQVGIYDDAFNINCVGDTFQSRNIPTILIEAGHFKNDYLREETRRFVFQSLLTALDYIANNEVSGDLYKPYFDIPQNEKLFLDVIIRKASVNSRIQDIGIQFKEKLIEGKIKFIPVVDKISELNGFYGHRELNATGNEVLTTDFRPLFEGIEIDSVSIKNEKILLIPKNN